MKAYDLVQALTIIESSCSSVVNLVYYDQALQYITDDQVRLYELSVHITNNMPSHACLTLTSNVLDYLSNYLTPTDDVHLVYDPANNCVVINKYFNWFVNTFDNEDDNDHKIEPMCLKFTLTFDVFAIDSALLIAFRPTYVEARKHENCIVLKNDEQSILTIPKSNEPITSSYSIRFNPYYVHMFMCSLSSKIQMSICSKKLIKLSNGIVTMYLPHCDP